MKTHAIHWTCAVSGRVGTGTKLFEQEDAERLAAELNQDYPEIDHQAVPSGTSPAPSAAEPAQAGGLPAPSGLAPVPQAEPQ